MRILLPRWIRPLTVFGFALLLLALVPPHSPQAKHKRYKRRTTTIGSGVQYTTIRDPRGPYRIRIISVRLSETSTIDVALANDRLNGSLETTSSMARRHGALAAVNGDYSLGLGRPAHPFGEDGHIVQWSPFWQNHNFAVDRSEKRAFIGPGPFRLWMQERDSLVSHEVRFANGGPPINGLALYTPAGGIMEEPPPNMCSARLYPIQQPRLSEDGDVVSQHKVDVVRCSKSAMARRGGKVLVARRGGTRAHEIRRLRSGELVTLGWTPGWAGAFESLGGWPMLLNKGRIAWKHIRGGSSFYQRHPRTGVGYDKGSGKVLIVTVDGRQPGYSIGMTTLQFARLFKSLGAEFALNLDGGGSTTTVVRGGVRNRPSDGRERPVSSALLVLPKGDRGEQAENLELLSIPGFDPPPGSLVSAPLLRRIGTDQGSTGGLAAAMRDGGLQVPRILKRSVFELSRKHR